MIPIGCYVLARKIILVVGMPGSGKTVIAEVAKDLGIGVFNMGDVIRDECMKRKLPSNTETYTYVMKDIRNQYGPQIVAKRTYEKISAKNDLVCIDGVRSQEEVEFFKKVSDKVYILAVISSFSNRLEHLLSRDRTGDPKNHDEIQIRDQSELRLGIGNIIAKADFYVLNENISKSNFRSKCKKTLSSILMKG
jgi:dephospho-CoA kinase